MPRQQDFSNQESIRVLYSVVATLVEAVLLKHSLSSLVPDGAGGKGNDVMKWGRLVQKRGSFSTAMGYSMVRFLNCFFFFFSLGQQLKTKFEKFDFEMSVSHFQRFV